MHRHTILKPGNLPMHLTNTNWLLTNATCTLVESNQIIINVGDNVRSCDRWVDVGIVLVNSINRSVFLAQIAHIVVGT